MAGPDQLPSTDAKVRFLVSAEAHPGAQERARLVETHMSWVVLCGGLALKLKKPVRQAWLDYSTPQARQRDALEEVRLNRRLAPGVYLGVQALLWRDGELSLAPVGETPAPGLAVDWLVVMQRLPDDLMLVRLMDKGHVTHQQVDALAAVLGRFYRHAAPAAVSADEYLARWQREQAGNRALLLDRRFALPGALTVLDRFDDAVAAQAEALRARVAEARIVEGHGDLRPQHVCLLQPPVVIDCLSFNPVLREVDPFGEIAFLGMECEMAGCAWIGQRLWSALADRLGSAPAPALRHLHAARHALLGARLALAHLLDPAPRTPAHWQPRAARYLQQAEAELQRLG